MSTGLELPPLPPWHWVPFRPGGRMVLTVIDSNQADYLAIVRPYVGEAIDEAMRRGARWLFVLCSEDARQVCPLRSADDALEMFALFVQAYAHAVGDIQIFFVVDHQLEGRLYEHGGKRFLQVAMPGGNA